jgi:hypothetical protein
MCCRTGGAIPEKKRNEENEEGEAEWSRVKKSEGRRR